MFGLLLGFCGGTFRLDSRPSGVGFCEPGFLPGGISAPDPAMLSLVLGCLRGLAGGLRALLSSVRPPPPPPGPPPTLSMLPTEWQESERGAMALRQGWGVCSWEAGIVMKPILRERRSEAMSRTRTPGPGPAPGPAGPAGATSLPELLLASSSLCCLHSSLVFR